MAGLSLYNYNSTSDTTWEAGKSYSIYDIYKYAGFYYYAITNHNSGTTFNSAYSNGVKVFSGQNKPFFFFIPSYNSELNIQPTVKRTQFGDGYVQRVPENINSILLPFNLTFDRRTDAETRAILHFLNARKGSESFVFLPPFPYNQYKLFVCENWTHSQVFVDNHTIRAVFQETPI